jgi:hypothetical protein
MALREILIWKNWLQANESRFGRYEYNIRLGEGQDPGASYTPSERRQWIANTMKRADVFAVKGGHVTIIEVEENPGTSAINQPLAYATLWRAYVRNGGPSLEHKSVGVDRFVPQDMPLDPDPFLMLVCARASNDAMTVAKAAGIEVDVVKTDFSVLKKGTTP